MAQTLLTIGMISSESLMILENELTFAGQVNRDYSDQFGKEGAKIGDTLNVRKPVRAVNSSGQGLILQDITETSVPVVLNKQYQRSWQFSSAQMALSIDEYAKRYIQPMIASMANEIDYDGMLLYQTVSQTVGTPGTVPNSTTTYLDAGVKLDNAACPRGDRNMCINPQMQATAVDAVKGLFNPQSNIGEYTRKGMIAKNFLGLDWYMDQNVRVHTVGALGGTPLVTSAPVDGATALVSKGWTAAAAARLNKGDVFTIGTSVTNTDAVLAVNPQSRQSTGQFAQFVVTVPFSSDGSGNGSIQFSINGSGIQSTGAYQNVNALPGANAPINVLGAANTQTAQGLAFHPDAFTFATADLPLYGGLDMAARKSSKKVNLSIRAIRDYDINLDRAPIRLDLLGGWAALYPELAVRIAS